MYFDATLNILCMCGLFLFFNKHLFIMEWQVADNKVVSDLDTKQPVQNLPESSEPSQPEQKAQAHMLDFNDEFVPGAMCE